MYGSIGISIGMIHHLGIGMNHSLVWVSVTVRFWYRCGTDIDTIWVSISVRAKSRLCDTMYHVCMILHLRQVLDNQKNIWQMGSLLVLATQSVYVPEIHFKLFLIKKNSFFF